jgi:histidinol-phosphate aminotransferase
MTDESGRPEGANRPPVRSDLASMTGYHSAQVSVEIRLNTNEAALSPPAGFAEAVANAAVELDWNRYPDRSAHHLRTKIGRRFGLGPGQVFCANGSNEVLQTVLLTYAGARRRTLTFEPTYALHQHLARITGSGPVAVERGEGFVLDPSVAGAAVAEHRPAVTFLCSPNNPTGLIEPRETVEAVLAAVEAVNGLLVVDEAYGEFSTWSAVDLLDEARPLAVSKTFSKTWAMAGARLGYLLGPSWLVDDLELVVLPYHLDGLKQAAGAAALEFVDEMEARVSRTIEQRGRIEAGLRELGCEVWPSGANFVLFRPTPCGDGPAGRAVWQGLVDRSVLVRDTSSWERLEGCLRVTVGTADENGRFLHALADILGDR